jgi:PleD family two-component response regulator
VFGRRADGARHASCPDEAGGAVRLFGDLQVRDQFEARALALQMVDLMALIAVSRRQGPGLSDAHGFAAIENRQMAKVLLIEDDAETAEEIKAELADRGFDVEWSANGIEGLEKARSSQPDAMIVDRLLPGMTA